MSSGGVLTVLASCAALPFEPLEQLLHRRERVAGAEQAFALQFGRDAGNDAATESAHVCQRGKHPHRRCAEREDAHDLDSVAGGTAQQEVLAELLVGWGAAANLTDVGNQECERHVDEIAVQLAAAQAERQCHGSYLMHDARAQGRSRTHETFGQRCHIANASALTQAAQPIFDWHAANVTQRKLVAPCTCVFRRS